MTESETSKPGDAHLIYIVEDERELREILKEALTHVGHRIRAASDGKEFLALMEQETPDLVLMDIGLPDISGWELRRRLQADVRHNEVPVIAVTGYGGPALEATALKTLDFSDYLRKPYSLVELINRIERVFDEQERGKPAAAPDAQTKTARST